MITTILVVIVAMLAIQSVWRVIEHKIRGLKVVALEFDNQTALEEKKEPKYLP